MSTFVTLVGLAAETTGQTDDISMNMLLILVSILVSGLALWVAYGR